MSIKNIGDIVSIILTLSLVFVLNSNLNEFYPQIQICSGTVFEQHEY